MKPPLVIDHQSKERNMEDLTIKLCKKKFCTYLTKMKEMWNEIDFLQKDGIKDGEQQFLTLTFDKLGKTAGNFPAYFKRQRSKWVNNP